MHIHYFTIHSFLVENLFSLVLESQTALVARALLENECTLLLLPPLSPLKKIEASLSIICIYSSQPPPDSVTFFVLDSSRYGQKPSSYHIWHDTRIAINRYSSAARKEELNDE